ncbi:uncharacterized protein LOC144908536 [Branchiostoma floridae x Branchiostoma belcheri]
MPAKQGPNISGPFFDNTMTTQFGREGQFYHPFAIGVSREHVYVADRAGRGRVQCFTFHGEFQSCFNLYFKREEVDETVNGINGHDEEESEEDGIETTDLESLTWKTLELEVESGALIVDGKGKVVFVGRGKPCGMDEYTSMECTPVIYIYDPATEQTTLTRITSESGVIVSKIEDARLLPNGCVALADQNKVHLLDPAGSIVSSLDLYHPEGFPETASEMCSCGNDTGQGSFIRYPVRFAVYTQDNAILLPVSITKYGTVKVLDSRKQTVCFQFGSLGLGDGQFHGTTSCNGPYNYPRDVCVDIWGRIIVSDYGNCRVHMFDQEGRFIKHVVTKESGLHTPIAVRTSRDGRVVVLNAAPPYVQIFPYKP